MLVQDIMRRDVITVGPQERLPAVTHLLRQRGIRHVPVIDEDSLVGIISDRDLKGAMFSAASSRTGPALQSLLDHLTAADIMTTRSLVTIGPMFPVEEAARLMLAKHISALPVTQAGRLVGIVTDTDVLQMLSRALGVTEPSSRIDVVLGDDPRALSRVVQTVDGAGAVISSLITLASPTTKLREAVVRLATIDPGPAIAALDAQGYSVRESWRG